MDRLRGRTVAVLATDGVEEVELTEPRGAVSEEGAATELLSLAKGTIQAMKGDLEPTNRYPVDRPVSEADPAHYDALLLPGGTVNADRLRMSPEVRAFVTAMVNRGAPVGVICHGPWTLVEADLVRGRTLTSFPSLRTDIRNAGGTVVDEQVVNDRGLVSSRDPGDLPAFCEEIVNAFASAKERVS